MSHEKKVGWSYIYLILLIVAAATCIGSLAYEGVKCQDIVEQYFAAFEDADAEKLADCTFPEDVKKELVDWFFERSEEYDVDEEWFWDEMSEDLEEEMTQIDSFNWEIEKVEHINMLKELEDREKETVSWYNVLYKYEGKWYLLEEFNIYSIIGY